MDISMLTSIAMTTTTTLTTSTTGLLHGHPGLDLRTSPVGFEATMSVAMELENKLKAEADGRSIVDEGVGTTGLPSPLDAARSRSSSPVTPARPPSCSKGHQSHDEDDYDYEEGERRKCTMDDDVGDCANSDVDGQLSPDDDMDMDDVSSCSPLPPTADTTRSEEDEEPMARLRHSEDGSVYDYRSLALESVKEGGNNGEQRASGGQIYQCQVCKFTFTSRFHFNSHMNTHCDHKCGLCDYRSRTEGRLKRHVRDFHSDTGAPDSCHGGSRPTRVGNTQNKLKTYKCKQCSFVATAKTDFWEHSKTHIKAEKLLTCPKCPFVTEYKHHLEYHLRNHFGSKPFKCPKCNYSCVNKSMLNSHMKSHSNIYQYRCSDCAYATKYCHSLKLHLRKYGHKPSTVLNVDGTPNPMPVIDVYGSRRGPRIRKSHEEMVGGFSPFGPLQLSLNGGGIAPTSATGVSGLPTYLFPANVNVLNGFHGMGLTKAFGGVKEELQDNGRYPPGRGGGGNGGDILRCTLCEFVTDVRETFTKHMLLHAAAENQDLCNLYGITSEALLQEQQPPPTSSHHQQTHSPLCPSAQVQLSPHQRVAPPPPQPHPHQSIPPSSELLVVPSSNMACHTRHPTPENHGFKQENGGSQMRPHIPSKFHHQQMQPPAPHPLEHLRIFSENLSVRSMFVKELLPHTFASFNPLPASLMTSGMQPVAGGHDGPQLPMTTSFSAVSLATSNSSPTVTTTARGNGALCGQAAVKMEERGPSPRQGQTPLDLSSSKDIVIRPGKDSATSASGSSVLVYNSPPQQQQRASITPPTSPVVAPQVLASAVSPPSKHRRKGKAFKLDRICMKLKEKVKSSPSGPGGVLRHVDVEDGGLTDKEQDSNDSADRDREAEGPNGDSSWKRMVVVPAPKLTEEVERVNGRSHDLLLAPVRSPSGNLEVLEEGDQRNWKEAYECQYCDMAFKDCIMYTVHMGYHGFKDPFKCNMCGHQTKDKVAFFLHIARTAHL